MALKYFTDAFLGGAHGTSNLQAARLFGIPASGTHAHAFVTSFTAEQDIGDRTLRTKAGGEIDLLDAAKVTRTIFETAYTHRCQ